jgi:isoquinoline 1-oxidoreductase subunit beta
VESAVVFALTAALQGRIDFHEGRVQQRNFPDYRMVLGFCGVDRAR